MNTKHISILVGPLLFWAVLHAPIPAALSTEAWLVLSMAVLMFSWWVTEAIPLAATSLLPIIILPAFGVTTLHDASAPYAHPVIFLFLGGFIISAGMQISQLHKRIAINITLFVGQSAHRIILGFMIAAAFLSMWLNNTVVTVMMMPIAISVAEFMLDDRVKHNTDPKQFATALVISVAYAASLGGPATLIGSNANIMMLGILQNTYQLNITFTQMLMIGVPILLIMLPMTWLILTRLCFTVHKEHEPQLHQLLKNLKAELGPLSRSEKYVSIVFFITVTLWMTQTYIDAWLNTNIFNNTSIAVFGALLMFCLPADPSKDHHKRLLDKHWPQLIPWDILLLIGGGLSLAAAMSKTGLSDYIALHLSYLSDTNTPVIFLIGFIVLATQMITEVISNTATSAAILPILATLAVKLGYSPLATMLPAALTANYAFMLPISTPPNAIAFNTGYINTRQMVKSGWMINLLAVLVVTPIVYFLGPVIFGSTLFSMQ